MLLLVFFHFDSLDTGCDLVELGEGSQLKVLLLVDGRLGLLEVRFSL